MPTKQPSLFDISGKEPPKEKLPTLSQYLKSHANATYPLLSTIRVVWYPGNWENYSLETDVFRASISPKHQLFGILEKQIHKVLLETETALLLSVEDSTGTIRFSESALYGKYSAIGQAGFKFVETPQ